MKLMLCSRDIKRQDWITLDTSTDFKPDILATIPPLPIEVTSVKWDEIELIHGITSFYPWEAEQLLREIKEVLAPDGKLILEQPNFDIAKDRVEWLFGDPALREPLHMNKWAYTPESLMGLLISLGYSGSLMLPQYHMLHRDFRVEAWK